jgi:hypothetical protein
MVVVGGLTYTRRYAEDSSGFTLIKSCNVSGIPSYDGGSNTCKKRKAET